MAVPVTDTETEHNSSTIETPIITQSQEPEQEVEEELKDTQARLSKSLHRLECFLKLLGFCQCSVLSFTLSWLCFLLLGVSLPLIIINFSYCSNCDKYEIRVFELEILASQSLVAAISIICISHNLRKYGALKFLLVDHHHGHMTLFLEEYLHKIHGFFQLLALSVLPCFLLKAARELIHVVCIHSSWWQSVGVVVALLVSWTYSTVIYLSGTALFHLVCNLQVIHFENYGKLLERDLDVSVYVEEHMLLKYNLSKISHRFRIFLLLEFLAVTATQFVALLEITGKSGIISFVNGGDFAVSSIVELVGIVICLNAAAKISHRAQGLGSVASRWHASVTCSPYDAHLGMTNNMDSLETAYPSDSVPRYYSGSDLESADYVPTLTNAHLASYMSMYHKRQAFVTYLQSSPGGATVFGWTIDRTTVFGWTIDRTLINTIFFIQLSLVLFVLGKTVSFTTK